jgi:hypothetical protein
VPQIDRLLTLLVQSRAASVELLDGEPAAFVTGNERRPVTRQPLAAAQILAFVREIAPPDVAASLGALQPAEFAYANGDGRFRGFRIFSAGSGERWGGRQGPRTPPAVACGPPRRAVPWQSAPQPRCGRAGVRAVADAGGPRRGACAHAECGYRWVCGAPRSGQGSATLTDPLTT